MKKEGHPKLNAVCFKDVSTGKRFLVRSAMRSKQTEVIDGEEHFLVIRDVTSDSHPAYTGEKRFVDTAGRVESFNRRYKRRGDFER
jgi:large subunit ribosomal protein L31